MIRILAIYVAESCLGIFILFLFLSFVGQFFPDFDELFEARCVHMNYVVLAGEVKQ